MTVVINYPAAGGGSGGGGGGGTITSVNGQTGPAVSITPSNINAFGLPTNWNASTNSPTLASSTAPTGNNDFIVTVAGTTSLDGNANWNVGDYLYFGTDGVWHRIAGAPQVGSALLKQDGTGGITQALSTDYLAGVTFQSGIPIGMAPTGSIANNGVLTLGTALNRTYGSPGIWLYFPANSVLTASAAGFYWCVMSSTTVGQIYTSTFTGSTSTMGLAGGYPVPTSPVAVSGTGGGAYTGVTSALFIPGVQIPAGTLGKNGALRTQLVVSCAATAGAKTPQIAFGNSSTSTIINSIAATSSAQYAQIATMYNRGAVNAQVTPGAQDTSVFGLTVSAIDSSLVQYVQPKISMAVATDFIIIEAIHVMAFPAL